MARFDKRAKHVKKRVNNSKANATKEVKALAKELFVSERTVWRDLSK